jgi:hypothetical protein
MSRPLAANAADQIISLLDPQPDIWVRKDRLSQQMVQLGAWTPEEVATGFDIAANDGRLQESRAGVRVRLVRPVKVSVR